MRHLLEANADNTTHPSILHRFPTELLLHITSFQSLRSHMALALTCRSFFYTLLDERTWHSFNRDAFKKLRYVCLILFDHLYPQHYLCEKCAAFHKRRYEIERVDGYDEINLDRLKTCEKAVYKEESVQLCTRPRLRITSHMVRLLHRATRLGPEYGIGIGSLCRELCEDNRGYILSIRTIAVGRRLLSRITRRMRDTPEMLQPSDYPPRRDKCFHWVTENEVIRECLNADERLRQTRPPTGVNIRVRTTDSILESPYAYTSKIMQCAWCPSLLAAALERDQGERRSIVGIVLVRWVDLGMAPNRKDATWKAHTRKVSNRSQNRSASREALPDDDRASPYIARWFQQHVGGTLSFDGSSTDFSDAIEALCEGYR